MSSSGWSCSPSSSGWPQTEHRPGQSGRSSGAMGSASEIASRTDGSRSSSWWSVRRSASGSSSRRPGCRSAGRSTGRNSSSRTRSIGRRSRPQAASALPGERRPQAGVGQDAAVRPGQADPTGDGLGELEVSGRSIVASAIVVGPRRHRRASASRPATFQRERRRRSAGRSSAPGHVRAGAAGSSASSSQCVVVEAARRRRLVARRRRDAARPPLVEQGDALLDALEGLLRRRLRGPIEDADRVLVGAGADLVGVRVGLAR